MQNDKLYGWISIHRKFLNHWLWDESKENSYAEAWLYLLLTAEYNKRDVEFAGESFELKEGQIITSLPELAKIFRWSVKKVRTFLNNGVKYFNKASFFENEIDVTSKFYFAGYREIKLKQTIKQLEPHKNEENKTPDKVKSKLKDEINKFKNEIKAKTKGNL